MFIRLCIRDLLYAGKIAFAANTRIIRFILPFYEVLFLDESVIADVISRQDRAVHGARLCHRLRSCPGFDVQ